MDILSVIRLADEKKTSDIHIVAFSPPLFRIRGALQPVAEMAPLTPEDIDEALRQVTTEEQRAVFERSL